jgi:pimeloyl-ACP methyl ester carboxylesterase
LLKRDPSLLQTYKIIIPDLPGYVDSTGYPFAVYNLKSVADNSLSEVRVLHDFFVKIGENHDLNVAASSMGGLNPKFGS